MGMGGGGGKANFNTSAFQKMEKQMAAKERMKFKLEELKEKQATAAAAANHLKPTSDPTKFVFSIPEDGPQERSSAISDTELIAMFDKPDETKHPKKKKAHKKK
jgi:hypothetical protein